LVTRKPVALVIDDEEFFRASITEALSSEGFHCYSAEDGDEGLELYRRVRPDVIVLDRIMPNSGGTRFQLNVRQNPNRRDAFLVVYSSTIRKDGSDASVADTDYPGFSQVIDVPKTVPPDELAKKIVRLTSAGTAD
jgi:CheY-like chemotaxis protein